jgi:hypothetical protein
VVERGEQARFTLESSEPIAIARQLLGKDFDGDFASELRVPRAIHLAHAAHAEQRLHLVHAQTLSDQN